MKPLKPDFAPFPKPSVRLPGIFLSCLLLLLAACQAGPQAQLAQTPQAKLSRPAPMPYKPEPNDSAGIKGRVIREGTTDKLVLKLGSNLSQRLNVRPGARTADKDRFRTQASDVSRIAFIRVRVHGPGMETIESSDTLTPVTGIDNEIVIPAIPLGPNRVVVADFFDANESALNNAVAMGVYSSGNSEEVTVDVRRRYLPLGQTLLRMSRSFQEMWASVDAAALQAQIDELLYNGGPAVQPFSIDPVLIDVGQIFTDLGNSEGNVAALDLAANEASYVSTVGSLSLPVSGLLGSDQITVRVDDPLSDVVTVDSGDILANGGVVTVPNVAPGSWPIYISLDSSVGFSYPESTYNGETRPPSEPDQAVQDLLISNGETVEAETETVVANTYNLVPAAPTISTPAGSWFRSGDNVTITGSGFYPDVEANSVRFVKGDTTVMATEIVAATATSLTVKGPDFDQAGAYTVGIAAGSGAYTDLGKMVFNAWAVKPDGAAFSVTNTGLGWDKAVTLDDALLQIETQQLDNNEIWLTQGTYKPTQPAADTSGVFFNNYETALLGGFQGNEVDSADRGVGVYSDLSGDHNGDDNGIVDPNNPSSNRDDNSFQTFNSGTDIAFDHIQFVDGLAALTCSGGITLTDVNFLRNGNPGSATVTGGGPNDFSFTNVKFENNYAQLNGGALWFSGVSGAIELNNVQFIGNQADNHAGALLIDNSYAKLTNVTFRNNTAFDKGGALMVDTGGRVDLDHVVFQDNTAVTGGGAYIEPVNVSEFMVMNNVVFCGNSATDGGGMAVVGGFNFDMWNSVFCDNTASNSGGAISGGPFAVLDHVTFSNNSAPTEPVYTPGLISAYNSLFWKGDTSGLTLGPDRGNVIVPDGEDPFVASSDPAGADGVFLTSPDGFELSGSVTTPIGAATSPSILQNDILGNPHGASADAGAYEFVN